MLAFCLQSNNVIDGVDAGSAVMEDAVAKKTGSQAAWLRRTVESYKDVQLRGNWSGMWWLQSR